MFELKREANLITFIKFFAYIIASANILARTTADPNRQFLMAGVTVLLLNGALRQFFLYRNPRLFDYGSFSLLGETLLVLFIGTLDNPASIPGISILLFMVTLSEATIVYPLPLSLFLTAVYLTAKGVILERTGSFGSLANLLALMVVGFGASIAFVFVMSYLVKMQMTEKEKLRHANLALEEAYGELLRNASKVQALSIEQERTRLAREIHDTLAHTLTTVVVEIEACKKLLPIDPRAAAAELSQAQKLVREGLGDIRRSVRALRPAVLESNSLADAVANLTAEVSRRTGTPITLHQNLPEGLTLPAAVEVAVYRMVQEAVTNSLRHSGAETITIELDSEAGQLTDRVRDNGRGTGNIKKGFGLQGISERVEALQGRVEFTSSPGQGFQTAITLPLPGGTDG